MHTSKKHQISQVDGAGNNGSESSPDNKEKEDSIQDKDKYENFLHKIEGRVSPIQMDSIRRRIGEGLTPYEAAIYVAPFEKGFIDRICNESP